MKHVPQKCKVCEKAIDTYLVVKGSRRKGILQMQDSDEGVLFNVEGIKAWFCNPCWDEIIKMSSLKKDRKGI